MSWVIVYGSWADGLQGVVGPFITEGDAENYAETFNLGHFSKHPIELERPDPRWTSDN